ncbi:MAG: trypsin-like peptidase domain-containing protein [Chloroflexi bacterium]|nr:trypsin-like peptidase domain-containing protein [Chloroflexota bacterium]
MAIKLSTPDFDRLVAILGAQPDFRTVQGRVDFMSDVFAGSTRRDDLLASLNLDGNPRGVAVRVIERLTTFGQDEPGREALGVLINKLLIYIGAGDDADFLRDLLKRYPFQTPPAATRGITDDWRGRDTPEHVLEKIIGENTLRDIRVLEILLDASRAVVRITSPQGLGSGFMIADDLVMTNHHVIASQEQALQSAFTFNYQLDRAGKEYPAQTVQALPRGLFHTSPEEDLDFTVVQLRDAPKLFDPLTLKPAKVMRDQRVSIIQHPGGHYKKISLQNNFVAFADARLVQYTTSTEPGSSGAPVFNDDLVVVAIHHAGGMLPEPNTQRRYLRNEGISMIAVLDDLKKNAQPIYQHLKK